MSNIPDYCEGFHFRFFRADKGGRRRSTRPDASAQAAEERILKRVGLILKNRPDLMAQLACLENGLEIHLYQGDGFKDFENELYFYGRATVHGDEVVLEFAVDEILYGGREDHEVMDVVAHELIHVIDLLDDMDGLLPGWSKNDIARYKEAREIEKERIREGTSPLVGYALTNNVEFLAVLAEVFFTRSHQLADSNPVLFELMADFFRQDPRESAAS